MITKTPAICSKFSDIHIDKHGYAYVDAAIVNGIYKTIRGKSRSTPKRLIKELQLDFYYYLKPEGSFVRRMMKRLKPLPIRLMLGELTMPIDGPHKDSHIELLRLIELLPDQ